jgi:hypothetical protein
VAVLPTTPLERGVDVKTRIGVHDELVVRLDEPSIAQTRRHVLAEPRPLLGEVTSHLHRDPVDCPSPAHRHRAEHERRHSLGMALRVRGPERGAPREPDDAPALDAELGAQLLEITQVVIEVDRVPVDVLGGGGGCAPAGGALVEHDGAMAIAVEQPPCRSAAA